MGEQSRSDARSAEALIYRQWYGTQRWKRRRRLQIRVQPFCAMCLEAGVYTPATIADHIQPHHGDPVKFWRGELQSLCKPHHDREKQLLELGALPLRVDADGWPITRA
jgi:hypothetical protein